VQALDGNAIAGELVEYFGAEMTLAAGTCAHCGSAARVAELVVYTRAPGAVVRCRACRNVVMVLVQLHGTTKIDFSQFRFANAPRAR
jgi:hypothetical protein